LGPREGTIALPERSYRFDQELHNVPVDEIEAEEEHQQCVNDEFA
jgi:hypothetical protein